MNGCENMEKIRFKDVAQRAGVSAATVTRVVRGSGYVSAEKRAQVEAVLKEMGYSFPVGRGASQPIVLMLLRDHGVNPLFATIAAAIAGEIQARGWHLTLHYLSHETPQQIVALLENMRQDNLKGVIFNCISADFDFMSIRKYLTSLPVPLVMVERTPNLYGLNKVMLNAEEMLFIAVKYLAHHGHRRIAFISTESSEDTEQMRIRGFHAGTAAMGIADSSVFLRIPAYSPEEGYRAIAEHIRQGGRPTAVIAADTVMTGVSNYLYERGLRVPADVSLVGLDNTISACAVPPITSVAFPIAEIAQNTVRILAEAQDGGALPQNVLLSTRLIERTSVAPPSPED